jgi:hypothetical protein
MLISRKGLNYDHDAQKEKDDAPGPAEAPAHPFWRLRHALGSRRVADKKGYSRGASRAATRRSLEEPD